ncbi:hypothetical protein FQA39_LY08070 [Lamprigera yunnana]|nr:hypothetical protein FQA39_LY08070 [Lamprigera yunnana]
MRRYIVGVTIIGYVLYNLKKYFAGRKCQCTKRLDGLVIIITGATSGIGKALAYLLAEKGASLILGCRDIEKASFIKDQLVKSYHTNVFIQKLDLNSFNSISKFSNYINDEFKQIYALINNAGIFYHPQQLTKDDFDITLQTNYLGPFVLTHCVLQSLKRSKQARIVNVVSEAHRWVQFQDLVNITKSQSLVRSHMLAYGVSKLGLVLFTKKLAREVSDKNIFVNAVNPGNVETNIFRHFPLLSNRILFALQWLIRVIVIKRPIEGAQTILHAILTDSIETGTYFADCKKELPSEIGCNDQIADQYYKLTLDILKENKVGLKPTENCKCYIKVSNNTSLEELIELEEVGFYIVGQSNSEFQRFLDNCLLTMHTGEISNITFHLEIDYNFILELVNFETEDSIYKWTAQKKFNLAMTHKTKGVELFNESRFVDASFRFGRGLKILCSIPIVVTKPASEINGLKLSDINSLKKNLYNNLSSSYLKCNRYKSVLEICEKIFEMEKDNVKALYKQGMAFCEMGDYENSQKSFLNVLSLEPNNKAAAGKLKFVNVKVAEGNVEMNAIIKKMFHN